MKSGIHPDYIKTQVTCSGCNITFESMSTVPEIQVEICSNCHPFYTGKQKLVDTAGRVDRFRAQTEAAQKLRTKGTKTRVKKAVDKSKTDTAPLDKELKIEEVELKVKTVSTINDIGSIPDSNDK